MSCPPPPRDSSRYRKNHAGIVASSARYRRLSLAFTFVIILATVAHNAATYKVGYTSNGSQATVGFGWPTTCYVGRIPTSAVWTSVGPRQHWAAISKGAIFWFGLFINLAVVSILSIATYQTLQWGLASSEGKYSISTALGLIAYMAFLFAFEKSQYDSQITPLTPLVAKYFIVETTILEYVESVVWISVFVTCLWLPNAVARRISDKSIGKPSNEHGAAVVSFLKWLPRFQSR